MIKQPRDSGSKFPTWAKTSARWVGRLCVTCGLAYGVLWGTQSVHDYATTSPRFEVSSLIYETTPHVNDDRLRDLLDLQPGTNILSLELNELGAKVAKDPWVAEATVKRHLPDTVEVHVREHEVAALVLSGKFYMVSDEGRVFKSVGRGERSQLPIITGIDRQLLIEDRAGAEVEVRRALDILSLYHENRRPRLAEIHLGDDGEIVLYTEQSGTQINLGRGEVAPKLARFDALRAALQERAEQLSIIHLESNSAPGRNDRVYARFGSAKDDIEMLTEAYEAQAKSAESETTVLAQSIADEAKPKKKRRIPRYR